MVGRGSDPDGREFAPLLWRRIPGMSLKSEADEA